MGFQKNFLWGAASASYQVEGAWKADGKGLNVWDACAFEKGRVLHGETGQTACEHYYRYREDVALMKEMGLKAYRFSINWARVIPDGTGAVNEAGLQFYSNLVDELLAAGIEPFVTLFHWDYPEALHQRGGWLSKESPLWFEEYTKVIVDALSDRVQYWITVNEPQIFIHLGYQTGVFAPFEKHGRKEMAQMAHHVLLSHGRAVRVIREHAVKKPTVGFAFTAPSVTPLSNSEQAIEAAREETFCVTGFGQDSFLLSNSFWADPIFFGDYPKDAYELLGEDMPIMREEDRELITAPVDFFGANIYQSMVSETGPDEYADNCYVGCPRTMTGWAITPEVLYWSARFMTERYKKPFLITENGMAGMDFVYEDGCVHDPQRIEYMRRYIRELKRAAEEGIDIMGYFAWSVMDNFEWASGYDMRFGLIYIDYLTQKRTRKDSSYWYQNIIETNAEKL